MCIWMCEVEGLVLLYKRESARSLYNYVNASNKNGTLGTLNDLRYKKVLDVLLSYGTGL